MAKVTFGAGVSGIRGSVGGATFSGNKSGPYVRLRSKGSNPRSMSQQPVRSSLSRLGADWRGMTQSLRDDWDSYAALPAQELTDSLGESYYASGWNWFCNINQNRSTTGQLSTTAVPTAAVPAAPTTPTLTLVPTATGFSSATFASAQFGTDYGVFLLAVDPREGRAAAFRSDYRIIFTVTPPSALTTITFASLEPFFGPIFADAHAFLLAYQQTTEGRRGPPASAQDVA